MSATRKDLLAQKKKATDALKKADAAAKAAIKRAGDAGIKIREIDLKLAQVQAATPKGRATASAPKKAKKSAS